MAEPLTFTRGVGAILSGLRRIAREPALRRLTVAPVLVTLLAYAVALAIAVWKIDELVAWVWAPPENAWLHALWALVVVVAFVVFAVILVLLFVGVANVVAGPFYERIARAVLVEHAVPRQDLSFAHGIAIELAWTLVFGVPAAVCGLLGLLPVVGPAFAAIAAAIAALGLAGAAAGPALSATGAGLSARLRLYSRRPTFMIGAALVLVLTVLVPILGLLVMPAAVVGVTDALARGRALEA